jgi:hypothetical protein
MLWCLDEAVCLRQRKKIPWPALSLASGRRTSSALFSLLVFGAVFDGGMFGGDQYT